MNNAKSKTPVKLSSVHTRKVVKSVKRASAFGAMKGTISIKGDIVGPLYGKSSTKKK